MRVGLLEDDMAIQEMLVLVLEDEGHTVTSYASVEECLESLGATSNSLALTHEPIDLMIVDWRLNDSMSGVEVIQQIRTKPHLNALPIILTTAATFSDVEELQKLRVALLEKPFSVDDIDVLVTNLMQSGQHQQIQQPSQSTS